MLPKIYISAPALCSWTEITQIIERFDKETVEVNYWDRKKHYDSSLFLTSDILVIVHPSNKFIFEESDLPSGVLKEFKKAIQLKKPIFLAYRLSSGDYNFYITEYNEARRFISGIAGTSKYLVKTLTKILEENKKSVSLDKINHSDPVIKNPCAEIPLPGIYHYTESISDVILDKPDPRVLLLIT